MRKALIVGKMNGYGLSVDSELLADALKKVGWFVETAAPRGRTISSRLFRTKHADAIFHLERVFPTWQSAAPRHFLVPNQERFPKRHIHRLKMIDRVLAKTSHAASIFAKLGCDVRETGFASRDRFDPAIEKDFRSFFHLAGGSTLKGTEAIIDVWTRNPHWPQLTIIQKEENAPAAVPENIELVTGYVDDETLKALQNRCGIHLCPSQSEGWGHHIHEGLSCGSIVITTDGPPMNEFVGPDMGYLVPVKNAEPRHLGINHHVDLHGLEGVINEALSKDRADFLSLSDRARQTFHDRTDQFLHRLEAALAEGNQSP